MSEMNNNRSKTTQQQHRQRKCVRFAMDIDGGSGIQYMDSASDILTIDEQMNGWYHVRNYQVFKTSRRNQATAVRTLHEHAPYRNLFTKIMAACCCEEEEDVASTSGWQTDAETEVSTMHYETAMKSALILSQSKYRSLERTIFPELLLHRRSTAIRTILSCIQQQQQSNTNNNNNDTHSNDNDEYIRTVCRQQSLPFRRLARLMGQGDALLIAVWDRVAEIKASQAQTQAQDVAMSTSSSSSSCVASSGTVVVEQHHQPLLVSTVTTTTNTIPNRCWVAVDNKSPPPPPPKPMVAVKSTITVVGRNNNSRIHPKQQPQLKKVHCVDDDSDKDSTESTLDDDDDDDDTSDPIMNNSNNNNNNNHAASIDLTTTKKQSQSTVVSRTQTSRLIQSWSLLSLVSPGHQPPKRDNSNSKQQQHRQQKQRDPNHNNITISSSRASDIQHVESTTTTDSCPEDSLFYDAPSSLSNQKETEERVMMSHRCFLMA